MKNLNSALNTHLQTGATTMALCWRVDRKDGVTYGFTEHDRNLTVAGLLYEAASGFTASEIKQSLGLSVDNVNLQGALSSTRLNETDLASGKYDDATLTLLWANWADTTQYVILMSGNLGEVKRSNTFFESEFRSISAKLNQATGRSFQRYCDAVLGDSKCKFALAGSTYSSTITSISSTRVLVASSLSGLAADYCSGGVLTFTSGPLNGAKFEVKRQSSGGVIELWTAPPSDMAVGNTFTISVGCDKAAKTCLTKFNNLANFQGFPLMPGNDKITSYANSGITQMDGSSLFPNWWV
ncbi:MAG: beta tubulin [Phenylobacterium zucineum]|nr:MAG: beta tubulin [Phenylobacterium zucineum]